METTRVGIREFRARLPEYIASDKPIAVTWHRKTVGYFIPARGTIEAELSGLQQATQTLDALVDQRSSEAETVISQMKDAKTGRRARLLMKRMQDIELAAIERRGRRRRGGAEPSKA